MKMTLRALRINKGLSLRSAARKFKISHYTLQNYEQGKTVPKVDFAFKAADIYNCSVDDIDFSCHSNPL